MVSVNPRRILRLAPLLPVAVATMLVVSVFAGNNSVPPSSPLIVDVDLTPEIDWDPAEARARCIMNIRNAQQGMRSFQNMNGFDAGGPGLNKKEIIGRGKFVEQEPWCPSGGRYFWAKGAFPKVGKLFLQCSHVGHKPAQHRDW